MPVHGSAASNLDRPPMMTTQMIEISAQDLVLTPLSVPGVHMDGVALVMFYIHLMLRKESF
jgi:hypothetical protein